MKAPLCSWVGSVTEQPLLCASALHLQVTPCLPKGAQVPKIPQPSAPCLLLTLAGGVCASLAWPLADHCFLGAEHALE